MPFPRFYVANDSIPLEQRAAVLQSIRAEQSDGLHFHYLLGDHQRALIDQLRARLDGPQHRPVENRYDMQQYNLRGMTLGDAESEAVRSQRRLEVARANVKRRRRSEAAGSKPAEDEPPPNPAEPAEEKSEPPVTVFQ